MIDILVPVLGRPHNTAAFTHSLRSNTTVEHRLVFICSPDDHMQIHACRSTAAETWMVAWEPGRADFAKKINWAFPRTHSEWVFQAADDIRFHPHWDTHALHVGERFAVVGTNDLHNPGVRRGQHATHLLFRRSYIEEEGGTFDGSGLVFSERYDHQFVDNEFVLTAQRRGQFGFAARSHVEHLHPHWGKTDMDATYEKALRNTRQDHRLFNQRRRLLERTLR